jgi:hypothetical protein
VPVQPTGPTSPEASGSPSSLARRIAAPSVYVGREPRCKAAIRASSLRAIASQDRDEARCSSWRPSKKSTAGARGRCKNGAAPAANRASMWKAFNCRHIRFTFGAHDEEHDSPAQRQPYSIIAGQRRTWAELLKRSFACGRSRALAQAPLTRSDPLEKLSSVREGAALPHLMSVCRSRYAASPVPPMVCRARSRQVPPFFPLTRYHGVFLVVSLGATYLLHDSARTRSAHLL